MNNIKAISLKSEGDENVRTGNYQAAIKLYLEAIQIDPHFLQAWNNLGYCYVKLGKTDEATQVKNKINEIKRNIEFGDVQTLTSDIPIKENLEQELPKQAIKPEIYFASSWDRWFAYILDSILVLIILLIPFFILSTIFPDNTDLFLYFIPVFFILYWLYFAFLEAGDNQATFGKRLLKLFVTDNQGNRLSFPRSLARSFFKIVLTLTPFGLLTLLNGIAIGSTAQSKGFHDYIAKTLVLTKKKTDKRAFPPDAPQKSSNTVYIIIIAIIAIILIIIVSAIIAAFIFGMAGATS